MQMAMEILQNIINWPFMYWVLVLTAFVTSVFTAAFGAGGGLILLAVLANVFPAKVVIPIHAITLIGSSSTRTWFLREHIQTKKVIVTIIGICIGVLTGAQVVHFLSDKTMQLILVGFLFYMLFAPRMPLPQAVSGDFRFGVVGAVASFIAMIVGAGGVVISALFGREELTRQQVVGSFSACITVQHLLRAVMYGVIGVHITSYLDLAIMMLLATIPGTYIGKSFLDQMPDKVFNIVFKSVLVVLAIRLLFKALSS